jgi:hypothetical protein
VRHPAATSRAGTWTSSFQPCGGSPACWTDWWHWPCSPSTGQHQWAAAATTPAQARRYGPPPPDRRLGRLRRRDLGELGLGFRVISPSVPSAQITHGQQSRTLKAALVPSAGDGAKGDTTGLAPLPCLLGRQAQQRGRAIGCRCCTTAWAAATAHTSATQPGRLGRQPFPGGDARGALACAGRLHRRSVQRAGADEIKTGVHT